jgi:hypothetical protein
MEKNDESEEAWSTWSLAGLDQVTWIWESLVFIFFFREAVRREKFSWLSLYLVGSIRATEDIGTLSWYII